MPEFVLTALDVTGIQRYIFASNRLRENIGASELVFQATYAYVFEALSRLHIVSNIEEGQLDRSLQIEKDGDLAAEVMYAGGGNVLILFRNEATARAFVTRLSKTLLEIAPGLELVAAHVPFQWEEKPLGGSQEGVRARVLKELARVKQERPVSSPLYGLGVTAACQSTGLAAVDIHPAKNYPISAPVKAKLEAATKANKRLIRDLPQIHDEGYKVPFEFDKFGRSKDEISYIAVVHADGNGMGERINKLANAYATPGEGNRAYIKAMREFSEKINQAGLDALRDTVATLLGAIEDRVVGGEVPLQDNWLPFRPLVFGGDDVTFVCDGRLGLHLAARYLEAFEQQTRRLEGEVETPGLELAAHACAGVAVVKSHYPFARAYQLAEQLCSSAKSYVRSQETGGSALDWHFAASGLLGDLADIRSKAYEVKAGKLYLRPLRLDGTGQVWRSWPVFSKLVQTFKTGETWADKRNKVIGLRQALREGPVAVGQFLKAYPDIELLPELTAGPAELREKGWADGICGYFDAIEAMDFFVPLKPVQGED